MKTYQKGYTLTEIMIAVGVVASLVIGGLGFYNHAIMKAQASQSHTAAKLVMDDVIDFYARFNKMPETNGNLAGTFLPQGYTFIQQATWIKVGAADAIVNQSALFGYVEVTFKDAVGGDKDSNNTQQALQGKKVRYYLVESAFRSYLIYAGCHTDIADGMLDSSVAGTVTPGAKHPILPECRKGDAALAAGSTTTDFPEGANLQSHN